MMKSRSFVAFLPFAVACAVGCSVQHGPSRRDVAQEQKERRADEYQPPPAPRSQADDAELVLRACGRPASDEVWVIYDKLYNGPVRRMLFRGRQVVQMDFIPSLPKAHQSFTPAPFPPPQRAPANLLPGAVWQFQEARMNNDVFVTARRLSIYLPCAADALKDDF